MDTFEGYTNIFHVGNNADKEERKGSMGGLWQGAPSDLQAKFLCLDDALGAVPCLCRRSG